MSRRASGEFKKRRFLWAAGLAAFAATNLGAQSPNELTVKRIYSQPSLSGRLNRGVQWSPDSKLVSFFETKGQGKDSQSELWAMDAATGERRLLATADKMETHQPADNDQPTT